MEQFVVFCYNHTMFKKPSSTDDMMKWIIGGAIALVLVVIGWFVSTQTAGSGLQSGEVDKSQKIAELGREHIEDISKIKFTSNPPTSGPHFATWAKPGQFDQVISDGFLLHSLEHGYIVISYNCDKLPGMKAPATKVDAAKLAKLPADKKTTYQTTGNAPAIIKLSANFASPQCQDLKNKLSGYTKVATRIIIVPRPQMDKVLALSAWGRLDTMSTIEDDRIKGFIHVYHNKGPEQTME
jgi:hypothetical protein